MMKNFLNLHFIDNLLTFCNFSFSILLGLEGFLEEGKLIQANIYFYVIFMTELILKAFALGVKDLLRDRLNRVDAVIVSLTTVEFLILKFYDKNFIYIRFLSAIKVFRMFRLIRMLKFMRFIVSILGKTMSSFIYLAVLIILLNFIYAVFGMQIFANQFDSKDPNYLIFNFDSFFSAFVTVFNIITLDNWITLLQLGDSSTTGPIITNVYLLSWMFIGNFILLNLFLAILLDGFTEGLVNDKNDINDDGASDDDQYILGQNTKGKFRKI